jgi:hypothetical protein
MEPTAGDADLGFEYCMIGAEYYVAGRFSTLKEMGRTAANQFHHAIEMLLKARLLETYRADDLKRKFGHDLRKLWNAYKQEVDQPLLLDPLDEVINGLHRWEDIRYPKAPKLSATAVSISQYKPPAASTVPKSEGNERFVHPDDEYRLCLEAVDELFNAIFRTYPHDADALKAYLNDSAIAVANDHNLHPIDW